MTKLIPLLALLSACSSAPGTELYASSDPPPVGTAAAPEWAVDPVAPTQAEEYAAKLAEDHYRDDCGGWIAFYDVGECACGVPGAVCFDSCTPGEPDTVHAFCVVGGVPARKTASYARDAAWECVDGVCAKR